MNKEGTFKTTSVYPHAQQHFGQNVLQKKKKKEEGYVQSDLMRKHDKWRKANHFIITRINPNNRPYLQRQKHQNIYL